MYHMNKQKSKNRSNNTIIKYSQTTQPLEIGFEPAVNSLRQNIYALGKFLYKIGVVAIYVRPKKLVVYYIILLMIVLWVNVILIIQASKRTPRHYWVTIEFHAICCDWTCD